MSVDPGPATEVVATPRPTWTAPMCTLDGHSEPALGDDEPAITAADARAALAAARQLHAEGHTADAMLQLRVVEHAYPNLADRIALIRGRMLLEAGQPGLACNAFDTASDSPDSQTRALARVGAVRCRITAYRRDADKALDALLRRYPALPQEEELRFSLARAREDHGDKRTAARTYYAINLMYPGSRFAAPARQRLALLAAAGVRMPALSLRLQVDRAERLLAQGPMDEARQTVTDLATQRHLPPDLASRIALMQARIARFEGRWQDAVRYMRMARAGKLDEDESAEAKQIEDEAVDTEQAAAARERTVAEARVKAFRGGRPWQHLPDFRLLRIVQSAAGAGLRQDVDAALTAFLSRPHTLPRVRLAVAIDAAGVGSDTLIARLLEAVVDHPTLGVAARYYRARALERLGRYADAEAELVKVGDDDDSPTRYYAMWSHERLWAVRTAMLGNRCRPTRVAAGSDPTVLPPVALCSASTNDTVGQDANDAVVPNANDASASAGQSAPTDAEATDASSSTTTDAAGNDTTTDVADATAPCGSPDADGSDPTAAPCRADATASADPATVPMAPVPREPRIPEVAAAMPDAPGGPLLLASLAGPIGRGIAPHDPGEGLSPPVGPRFAEHPPAPPNPGALADQVASLATRFGDAYPWLSRAEALLRLGELDAASDEVREVYLAWRGAEGHTSINSGLEAVYMGDARPANFVSWKTRHARLALDAGARGKLADVAEALGDWGTAIALTGWDRANEHPRAFAQDVQRAARRYGIDPNLLFAVMRVESVYQPHIVSYAGAIGLMQIMPRTGRLIANRLGRRDYSAADLLDPQTNLDFAAWYLSSLIRRFDGRLPLAIAAYNGGPHNVRRWLAGHADRMPLDAFLEEIPFGQTHRYVRRVLTHYAAYRRQQGLPMEHLSERLPEPSTDDVGF